MKTANRPQPLRPTTTNRRQFRPTTKPTKSNQPVTLTKVKPYHSINTEIKVILLAFWDGSTKDILLIASLCFNLILGKITILNYYQYY